MQNVWTCSLIGALLLFGCNENDLQILTIEEAFVTESYAEKNVDSLAEVTYADGKSAVFCTAKESDEVLVLDGEDGKLLKTLGGQGTEVGKFSRPNGIAISGKFLYVVERDNHRIQTFKLPGLEPAGIFGTDKLVRPYGIWISPVSESGEFDLYIADQPEDEGGFVTIFKGKNTETGPSLTFTKTFGKGTLGKVESIWGDPENDQLLIAQESKTDPHHKVYTLAGEPTDKKLGSGLFKDDPEGLVLYKPEGKSAYWICVDQGDKVTLFHVFELKTLKYITTFKGKQTANTDGICLRATSNPARLYAIDDDSRVTAFDLPNEFTPIQSQ